LKFNYVEARLPQARPEIVAVLPYVVSLAIKALALRWINNGWILLSFAALHRNLYAAPTTLFENAM